MSKCCVDFIFFKTGLNEDVITHCIQVFVVYHVTDLSVTYYGLGAESRMFNLCNCFFPINCEKNLIFPPLSAADAAMLRVCGCVSACT